MIPFLKYGLGLGLLAWIIGANWHISAPDGQEIGLAGVFARPIDVFTLTQASVVYLASEFLTFVRWHLLVRAQGLPFSIWSATRLGIIGFYFSTFLPSTVGGDVIKAAFMARQQSQRAVAVMTVVIDRLIGLVGLVWLMALVGGFFWMSGLLPTNAGVLLESIILGAAALTVASVLFWIVLVGQRHFLILRWRNLLV